ncbi:hypothetical protein M8818_000677 [Zalaria obscura]|uniref:Uncharacterized protein n=1 Tax=Zalaria obscura TaxID=2024903 RepID=A0ACC3SMW0_9PEZI
MLRRPPTKITLTQEDLASFDERKAKRDHQKRQEEYLAAMNSQNKGRQIESAEDWAVNVSSHRNLGSTASAVGSQAHGSVPVSVWGELMGLFKVGHVPASQQPIANGFQMSQCRLLKSNLLPSR